MSSDKQLVELIDNAVAAWREVRDHIVNHGGLAGEAKGQDVLTEAQIAERLYVSKSTLRKQRARGRYPFFFREGGRWVTTGALYAKWLESREKRAGTK